MSRAADLRPNLQRDARAVKVRPWVSASRSRSLVPLRLLCGVILFSKGGGSCSMAGCTATPLLEQAGRLDRRGDKTYKFFLPVVQTARAHPKIFGALVTLGELVIGAVDGAGPAHAPRRVPGRADALLVRVRRRSGPGPPGNALLMGAMFVTFRARAAGPRAGYRRAAARSVSPAGWSDGGVRAAADGRARSPLRSAASRDGSSLPGRESGRRGRGRPAANRSGTRRAWGVRSGRR